MDDNIFEPTLNLSFYRHKVKELDYTVVVVANSNLKEKTLNALFASILDHFIENKTPLILDLKSIYPVTSVFMGTLVRAVQKMKEKGLKIAIDPSPSILELIEMGEITNEFHLIELPSASLQT